MQSNSVSKGTQQKLHKHFQHPWKSAKKLSTPIELGLYRLEIQQNPFWATFTKLFFRSGNQKRPLLAHDQSLPTKKKHLGQ